MIHCRARGDTVRGYFTASVLSVACLGVTVQGQRQVFPGQRPAAVQRRDQGRRPDLRLRHALSEGRHQGTDQGRARQPRPDAAPRPARAWQNVVAATVYLKNAADAAAMTEVWRTYWPKDAPTRTTVVAELVVADRAGRDRRWSPCPTAASATSSRRPDGSTANPYSYANQDRATRCSCRAWSRAARKDNSPVEGDVTAQMNTIFANADELLKAAGFALADVVANARLSSPTTQQVPGNEQGLRAALPEESAGARHRDRRAARTAYKVEITMTAVKRRRRKCSRRRPRTARPASRARR